MKEFLPILLGVLFFAVQTYSNYKKEQEKAKNRKLGKPVPDETIPVEIPSKNTGKRIPKQKESRTPGSSLKGASLTREALKPSKTPTKSSIKPFDISQRIEIEHLDLHREQGQGGTPLDLDLREAVIHQVILERKF